MEFENVKVKIGEEIVCRDREAEPLQRDGFITPSDRELDPNEPKDKEMIEKCDSRAKRRHADIVASQATRERQEPEEPVEDDTPLAVYRITGEAEYLNEDGTHGGFLPVGSDVELPVIVGDGFVEKGVAEKVEDAKPATPKRKKSQPKK